MKYITTLVLGVTLLGCIPECEVGDTEACNCLHGGYINYCTPEGYYPECQCYDNGGTGSSGDNNGGSWPPTGNDYTPGNTEEELLDYFLQCEATYVNDCAEGEIKIPCTTICWRRCLVGMDWYDGGCHGYPDILTHSEIVNHCKQLDQRYRLPSLDEVAYLLNQCYTGTFNPNIANYCSPFQTGAMRFVMDPPWQSFYSSWVGKLDWCEDQYGSATKSCAWFARFYVNIIMDTDFNWLYANGYAGSALAGGMCVRDN